MLNAALTCKPTTYHDATSTNQTDMQFELLEWAVFFVQTLVIGVGYPGQIYKNYHAESNGEHSFKLYAITVMFALRTVQNIQIDAWYYYLPDMLGLVLMGVTISQIRWPRSRVARVVSGYFEWYPSWIKK